jgi:hypothetical protein
MSASVNDSGGLAVGVKQGARGQRSQRRVPGMGSQFRVTDFTIEQTRANARPASIGVVERLKERSVADRIAGRRCVVRQHRVHCDHAQIAIDAHSLLELSNASCQMSVRITALPFAAGGVTGAIKLMPPVVKIARACLPDSCAAS